MTTEHPQPTDDWTECRPGEVAGLVRRLRHRRTLRRAQILVGAATCLLAALFVGSLWMNPGGMGEVKLTHAQLLEMIPAYVDGTLDAQYIPALEHHLVHCERCRVYAESLRQDDGKQAAVAPAVAELPHILVARTE